MSTLRHPVGPQPPSVYWRRRLVVLLGLLAIVVIVVLIVWNGGRGSGEARETPAPTGSASASPPPDQAAGAACEPAVLRLEALTDANSYPAGQNPLISLRVTNTGSVPCTFVLGADELVYRIVSGPDPIWNSGHCLTTPAGEVVLEPNVPVENEPISWDRTRSDPATCQSTRDPVVAGGATYRVSVAVGELESETDTPFLLY